MTTQILKDENKPHY